MVYAIEVQDIIKSIFQDVRGYRKTNQLKVCCPRCQEREGLSYPDGKYNLEINTQKNVFKCWKCDSPKYSGSIGRLIRDNGSYDDVKLYKSYEKIFYNDLSYLYSSENNEDVNTDDFYNVEVKLPYNFISFKDINLNLKSHVDFYNYWVLDRQLSYEKALEYNIGFCREGEFKDRLIIPSYNKYNELNYYTGRYIGTIKKTPKYKNPEIDKTKFIINENNIDWNSTIYLVEGFFDMFSLPKNTIPLMGKKMYKLLYNKISENKPNIIIILDKDAEREVVNLYRELILLYEQDMDKIRVIKFDENIDIDEYRRKFGERGVIKLLYSATTLDLDDFDNIIK